MTTFLQLNKFENLTHIPEEDAWRLMGACSQSDPDLAFKGDQNKEYEGNPCARDEMKALCITCPIAQNCLDHAIVNDERYGIWGGLTTLERDEFRSQWAQSKGKDGIKQTRRRYGLSTMDAGKRDKYEVRLARAREARDRFDHSGIEGYGEHLEVLNLLISHPHTPCSVLALSLGRKRFWFEHRFNEICKLVGVS